MTNKPPAGTTRYWQARHKTRLADKVASETRRRAQLILNRLPKEPVWVTEERLMDLEDAVCSARQNARWRRRKRRLAAVEDAA